jgi:undecaprenyl diphosphate synthase
VISLKAKAEPVAVNGAGNPPRHVAIIMDGNGRWAKARRERRFGGL